MSKIDNYPPALQEKRGRPPGTMEMFRNAVKIGVKISFSTDAAVFPHGQNAKEFALMTGLGMAPIDALKSAMETMQNCWAWPKNWHVGKRQARRHHCDAGGSDCRHYRDGACLVRDERRENHPERTTGHANGCQINRGYRRRGPGRLARPPCGFFGLNFALTR